LVVLQIGAVVLVPIKQLQSLLEFLE
jgi:hypothetical protein